MATLVLDASPVAQNIRIDNGCFTVELVDGRSLSVPLDWYPRLRHATQAELNNWRLLGAGYAIEWPDLDEHIGVEGLLAGRPSGESERSLQKWLEERRSHG